ncbi:MAG: glucosylceramidase, partial [Pedobacter sp.]
MKFLSTSIFALFVILGFSAWKKETKTEATSDVSYWLTKGDKSALLQRQNVALNFTKTTNSYATIEVDETQSFQTIDGFGYTLTGGSATLINNLGAAEKDALIKELFSTDENAIGVSYLRVSIGASDL